MPRLRRIITRFAEKIAERKLQKRCALSIGAGTKISYRNLGQRPPAALTVGEGSIFQATIISDRENSIISVGNNTFVGNSRLVCAEEISIGNNVLISWGCTIVDHNSHSTDWTKRETDVREWHFNRKDWSHVKIGKVRISDNAWIGFNSIILKGVTIGEGAIVGAGSVVTKNVEPFTIVAGNPARVLQGVS
ncbi:MAG: acyltransferase [Mesorhizobium sp.]|nr:MAG: acyltransferase [Mesorhizobium sp.]RWM43975.1 MAG: acyltransferase [Mesorhizobium sp.]RWM51835.1 MAG: acyltransferase [Mesorhizobium sp.]RWM61466.1 MAG: acyltransferase [Mesorhizobium sp.]RWM97323.1 MAG: acyltransferase [Mesorhizobium sp.]